MNLPVVCASNDDSVEKVELAVVDRSGRAVSEVGVTKHSLHALELLARRIQYFILYLVVLGPSNLIVLSNYLIRKCPIIFEITNLTHARRTRANLSQIRAKSKRNKKSGTDDNQVAASPTTELKQVHLLFQNWVDWIHLVFPRVFLAEKFLDSGSQIWLFLKKMEQRGRHILAGVELKFVKRTAFELTVPGLSLRKHRCILNLKK